MRPRSDDRVHSEARDIKRIGLLLGIGVGMGGAGLAPGHDEPSSGKVRVVAERDIAEKLDGKDAKATVVELTLEPGQAGKPHRHNGPVFGYVLEGEYEHAIDDQPAKVDDQPATVLKAGDTFYEPTGCLHRVSRSPGKVKTRVLATILQPRDGKPVTVPEPAEK
jgi:quercetin dioxygenase-like cupin family protein